MVGDGLFIYSFVCMFGGMFVRTFAEKLLTGSCWKLVHRCILVQERSRSWSWSQIRKTLIQRISETNNGIFMKIYPHIKSFYQNCKVKYGKNLNQIPWWRCALSELLLMLYFYFIFVTLNILWKGTLSRYLEFQSGLYR